MTARTGVPTMIAVAHELCRLIVKFTPIITALYPTNTALLAALAAANSACATLGVELQEVRIIGD